VEVNNVSQEIAVTKVNGAYIVNNVQSIYPTPSAPTTTAAPTQNGTVVTINPESEEGTEIAKLIESSSDSSLSSSSIISITSSDSLLSTIYTVQVQDSTSQISILEFLAQSGENLTLISTNQVQSSLTTQPVQESITTKTVSAAIGQTVTTTNDISVIQNEENQIFIAELAKTVQALQQTIPVVIQTTAYGNFVEKTIVVKDGNSTLQVTSLFNKTSNKITVIDSKNLTVDNI
jgi:hypothetical protein